MRSMSTRLPLEVSAVLARVIAHPRPAHAASDQFKALIGESETLLVGGRAGLKVEYYDKF